MKDIIIYGNLVLDIIFDKDNDDSLIKKNIGGIINTWNHFIQINNLQFKIDVIPLYYGEAFILINKKKSERYSSANLNLKPYTIKYDNTKWSHLMYLNYLNLNVEELIEFRKYSKVISADLCIGNHVNIELLPYIDFLFISEDEYYYCKDNYRNNIGKYIILHSPTNSKFISKEKEIIISEKELKDNGINELHNINVLGAGDFFAASFIYKFLELELKINEDNIKISLLFAHKSVFDKFNNQ